MLEPGTPGNPDICQTFPITSPGVLKQAVNRMITDFDLPLAVIEKLILNGFENQADCIADDLPVPREDLIREFRQVFNKYAVGITGLPPKRTDRPREQKHPYIRKYVWQVLARVVVIIPPDFTTDGITTLFRNLESCMLASHTRDTAERIQSVFNELWGKNHPSGLCPRWQPLFAAEKAANVYGLAAAAAMACFQIEVYMPKAGLTQGSLDNAYISGMTHPLLLRFMAQPVIGQGRWAIQSSVSVRNAHPFMDRNQKRAVVLNGQFDSQVETRIKEYLTRVAGFPLRTENSTEYFAMLWGLYFDTAYWENRRYKSIEAQHHLGLEQLSVASQSIDFTVFKNLTGKDIHELDEMAFIRAAEAMIPFGGQFAVSGISRISPDRLFLAAHNRPLYIVKRLETDDFMVVSDINAALGLFDQELIRSTSQSLGRLMKTYAKKSVIVEPDFFSLDSEALPDSETGTEDNWFRREKKKLLSAFQVEIYALEGPRLFASICTRAGHTGVARQLNIRHFSGKKCSDIRPEKTVLTPLAFQTDFNSTFYEEHLHEIPDLLKDILDRYVDPHTGLPGFDISVRTIKRRFGNNLADVNRIILIGTGFTYALAEIVEKTMEQFFTGINIVTATPLEITKTFINPDRDLVVMMSWSGTTSDIIDVASKLLAQKVLMVGFTEKPFSDLALVVRKSAGVIPALSGEEVTTTPIKSAVCMLMTLDLFCLWLCAADPEQTGTAAALTAEMGQIPGKLSTLLNDPAVETFCRQAARDYQTTRLHYIADAFYDIGTAKIGALNLEANAWTSMGHALDYSELPDFLDMPATGSEMVLVNATCKKRSDEAIKFMAALKACGRPFVAAGTFGREQARIEDLADRAVFLPDLPDYFQPFLNLPFMFLLGFYYGLAQGRRAGEMPRNLVKSVTAGRIKGQPDKSAADILNDLERKGAAMAHFPAEPWLTNQDNCLWIRQARSSLEAGYYRDLIRLGQLFHAPDPFGEIFGQDKGLPDTGYLSRLIFKHLAEDGIMIFVPMDRQAEAACKNFIRLWEPFLDIPLQIEYAQKFKGVSTEDSLVVAVASQTVSERNLAAIIERNQARLLWIGPGIPPFAHDAFAASCGACFLPGRVPACAQDYLYAALTLLFSRVMAKVFPERSEQVTTHFKLLLPMLTHMLDSRPLNDQICLAVSENRAYEKRLFVSGAPGNCAAWQAVEERFGPAGTACEPFGVSVYHHLVLVDPAGQDKYVKIMDHKTMADLYSEAEVRNWEQRFLGGICMDEFLKTCAMPFQTDAVHPFQIDDQWFLPVLNPGYDTGLDCLVTIDATSVSRFDAALDELAVFGTRYARTTVIAQEGFTRDARLANLKKQPISHLILIPAPSGKDGVPVTWSDFLMPVAVNLIGQAMARLDQAMAFEATR